MNTIVVPSRARMIWTYASAKLGMVGTVIDYDGKHTVLIQFDQEFPGGHDGFRGIKGGYFGRQGYCQYVNIDCIEVLGRNDAPGEIVIAGKEVTNITKEGFDVGLDTGAIRIQWAEIEKLLARRPKK